MMPIPRWKDALLWIAGILLLAAFLGQLVRDEVQAQVGPPNSILCNHLAQASPTAVTSQVLSLEGTPTQPVLRGVAGQRIYICGWHVTATAGTASTFQLVAGTDSGVTPG